MRRPELSSSLSLRVLSVMLSPTLSMPSARLSRLLMSSMLSSAKAVHSTVSVVKRWSFPHQTFFNGVIWVVGHMSVTKFCVFPGPLAGDESRVSNWVFVLGFL